jgi:hypothetical protein
MDCCSPFLDYIIPLGAAALGGLLFHQLGKKKQEDLEYELFEAQEANHSLKAETDKNAMHFRTVENTAKDADFKYNKLDIAFQSYKTEVEKESAAQKAVMNNTILLLRNDLEKVQSENAAKLAEAEQKLALVQNDNAAKVAEAENRLIVFKSEYENKVQSVSGVHESFTASINESKRVLADLQSRYTMILTERDIILKEKSSLKSDIANLKIDLETERRRYTSIVTERDRLMSERSSISSSSSSIQTDLTTERNRYTALMLNFGSAEKRITELETHIANMKIDVETERRRYTTLLGERDKLLSEKDQLSLSMGSNKTDLTSERLRITQLQNNFMTSQSRINELEIEIANINIDLKAERNRYRILMGERDALLAERSNGFISNGKTTITTLVPKAIIPDDLEMIEGIGAKIEQLLYDAGIKTFRQLSQTPVEKLRAILDAAGNRFRMHDPGTWAQQATLAAEGKWADLDKLKDALIGGKVSI